jgi:hypothetical protein
MIPADKIVVSIIIQDTEGNTDVKEFVNCKDLRDATRLCHIFKPKKGWKIIRIVTDFIPVLV